MYKIMLVDDELPALEYAEELINYEAYGFKIVCKARSGEEGVELFKEYHPDVIITDVVMPGMDGLEMVDRILKEEDSCLFILLTAYNEFSYAQKAIKMEVKSYLLKHELYEESLIEQLERIKKILDKRMAGQEQKKWMLFKALLERQDGGSEDIKELFLKFEIIFKNQVTVLIILQFEKSGFYGDETKWKYAIEKVGKGEASLLSVWGERAVLLFSSIQSTRESLRNEKILSFCAYMSNWIRQEYESKIYIGVSGLLETPEELFVAYIETEKILQVRFFKSKNRIFFLGRTALMREGGEEIREKLIKEFESAVKKWDGKVAEKILQELMLDVHVNISSMEAYQEDVEKLVGILYQNLQISITVCYERIEKCRNIKEAYGVLCELLEEEFMGVKNQYSPKMLQILKYIQEHICEKLSLNETAERVGVNAAYLSQLFKKEVGISFKNYVNQKKIEKAEELLKSGQYRIYEVADYMGFQTVQHFCNTFKKVTGEAPGKYKV